MKFAIVLTTLLVTFTSKAEKLHSYYPQETENYVRHGGEELKEYLFTVLNSTHQKSRNGGQDTLGCDSNNNGRCYSQISLGYRSARKVLFGKIHLRQDSKGYYIKDVYCQKTLRRNHTRSMGPGQIPNSNVLNCEHTWPQSKFSRRFDKGLQKSDLHHLYPTDSRANSVRGNYEFDDVDGFAVDSSCTASQTQGNGAFEPPREHKGNVARALFYFSVRYNIQISNRQEETLRQWHLLDPVDADERERNEIIYKVQNNRNPFIDMPSIVNKINNF